MLNVHMVATMHLSHAALPGMISRGWGGIINVASSAAFMALPGEINYCATKAYLVTFSQALAAEVRRKGVRVQALCLASPSPSSTTSRTSPVQDARLPPLPLGLVPGRRCGLAAGARPGTGCLCARFRQPDDPLADSHRPGQSTGAGVPVRNEGRTPMISKPWLDHYDEGIPKTLEPYPRQTLVDVVDETTRMRPNHTALIFKGERISYGELAWRSDALATALVKQGVKKGDRVAILMPNCPQYVIAEFAIWKAGGIVASINPLYTERESNTRLTNAAPRR